MKIFNIENKFYKYIKAIENQIKILLSGNISYIIVPALLSFQLQYD